MPQIRTRKFAKRRQAAYKKTVGKATNKRIRKVAIKAVKSLTETKVTFINYSPQTVLNNTWYAINAFYDIGQGTADYQRIGDKIWMQSVQFRMNLLIDNTTMTAGQQTIPQFHIRILLVQNKTRQSNGAILGTFPIWGGDNPLKAGYPMNGIIDKEKFTVMSDRKYTVNPNNNLQKKQNWYKNVTMKMGKSIQYDADNGGYLKFKNYYILFQIYVEDSSLGLNTLKMNLLQSHRYKDL